MNIKIHFSVVAIQLSHGFYTNEVACFVVSFAQELPVHKINEHSCNYYIAAIECLLLSSTPQSMQRTVHSSATCMRKSSFHPKISVCAG